MPLQRDELTPVERLATDGVGFVFTGEDTVAGVDLDDCRDSDTGEPTNMARDAIECFDS